MKDFKLNNSVLCACKAYLEENEGISMETIDIEYNYTRYEILDMYLKWEGIFGYTDDIYSIFVEYLEGIDR